MIAELPTDSYEHLHPLIPQPCIHLAVESILRGQTPARVFVDAPDHPQAALIWARNHFYLAGDPGVQAFNQDLHALFNDTIFPQRLSAGGVMLELFPLNGNDPAQALTILAGKDPLPDRREYYRFEAFTQDWKSLLPEGMALAAVDQALLAQKELANLTELADELVSERPTVASFLEKSFGVALVTGNELAGWCLSEYNLPDCCEVGIETVEAYRKRGLGTLLGSALVNEAQKRGITQVGWHCFAWNAASGATARKIGFSHVTDYPIYFAWYHPASNLAVHGNIYLSQGLYSDSLGWFEKSLALEDAPAWAHWGAACACARLDQPAAAFGHLSDAIARGFTHTHLFQNSPHLESLRGLPEWAALIARIKSPLEN